MWAARRQSRPPRNRGLRPVADFLRRRPRIGLDLTRAQGTDTAHQQLAAAMAVAEREQAVRAMAVDRAHGRGQDQSMDAAPVFDHHRAAEVELER